MQASNFIFWPVYRASNQIVVRAYIFEYGPAKISAHLQLWIDKLSKTISAVQLNFAEISWLYLADAA